MATQDQRHPHAFDVPPRAASQTPQVHPPAPAPAAAAPRHDDSWTAHYCPECEMPAWVEWRDGDHVKVRCFSRHWFLMLDERLR